eukprot:774558-Prorocentrum_minimum.AAC.1
MMPIHAPRPPPDPLRRRYHLQWNHRIVSSVPSSTAKLRSVIRKSPPVPSGLSNKTGETPSSPPVERWSKDKEPTPIPIHDDWNWDPALDGSPMLDLNWDS